MAQIPDIAPLDPQGTPIPADTVRPTDFGLGQAASELERVAMMSRRTSLLEIRAQALQDRQAAATSPAFQAFGEADARGFAADAGAWNGQPGFAADQVAKVNGRAADALKAYEASGASPGQLSEFRALTTSAMAQRGAQANDWEQRQLMAGAQAAQETTLNGYKTAAITAFAPVRQSAVDGFDGSTPTLIPQIAAGFDQATAPVLAGAPDTLKPRLALELSAMKQEAVAQAAELQGHAQDAFISRGASDQADALTNTVVSNPLAYDQVVAQLPAIAATLPAGLRQKWIDEQGSMAAAARVQGLIAQDKSGQALAELNDGRYDHILKPEQKATLEARALADDRANGPEAIAEATTALQLQRDMQADIYARTTTGRGIAGGVNLDTAAKILSPKAVAEYTLNAQSADRTFAATGPIAGMSAPQLARTLAEPRPDPSQPDYAVKLQTWEAQQQAAQKEAEARAHPGAWAWSAQGQTIGGQPMGAVLQQKWQAAAKGDPAAMADYAGTMLQVQMQAGIGRGAWELLPQQQASALAASVAHAPPDGRAAAMQGLAGLLQAVPAQMKLTDGTIVSPRAMLAGQLAGKGGLSGVEASAIADFGGSPVALGRVAAALNDSRLKEPLARGSPLPNAVRNDLAPFLATDPSGGALAEGRIQRTLLVARELTMGGMDPMSAARQAADDLTGGYAYQGGWRMPAAVASDMHGVGPGSANFGLASGQQLASIGAARVFGQLTANGGAGLYAPAGVGGAPASRQAIFASQVQKSGAWKTLPDDSGLMLAVPKPDGTWAAVADKYGRPVTASWAQLQGVAQGQPSPFAAAPPDVLKGAAGQPVRAVSRPEAMSALAWSVEQQESGGNPNIPNSPKGAMGVMQIMPDTLKHYAPMIGLPVDEGRAMHDPAYNRQVGHAALADLISRYGTGAGLGLALAAYNAGPGRLEGFRDARGYHPGWLATIGDPRGGQIGLDQWVSRIPFDETRNYVRQVLSRAVARLGGGE